MKRVIIMLVSACLILSGCTESAVPKEGKAETGKLKVVTTLFPYYDFVRQIAGDKVDLTMVVPAGMDSHSFEPTPADMVTIQNADVLICNGGAMEHWLEQVLESAVNPDRIVAVMMDSVDYVEEEHVEGMEEEDEHEHEHQDHDHVEVDLSGDDGHAAPIEYDEHIWTSPVNARKIAAEITRTLTGADPEHAEYYQEHAAEYDEKLQKLDQDFWQVMKDRKRSMIIVGDKFPFRYLADEYGLSYRAAFSGCSTDTEPSARTIAYLVDKVKEEQIPVIYYLELSSHRVSEIIGEETGAVPLLLHSCHNVTRSQFDGGITYLELMEQNVENLRKGLDE